MSERAYVPMRFLKNLVQLVADEEQISPKIVLHGTGVSSMALFDAEALATFDQQIRIYERVAALSTIPGLGFRSPSARNFGDQGVLGALLIMAPTVYEALKNLVQFIDVLGGVVGFEVEKTTHHLTLRARNKVALSPGAHRLVTEENLALWKFSSLPVPGMESYLKEIHLDYAKPRHWRMYTDLFDNINVKFGCASVAAVLSGEVADCPIPTYNEDAYRELQVTCSELLDRIQSTLKGIVNDYLDRTTPENWTVACVADALNMSQKTLARRLSLEETSAKELIEVRRYHHALSLMEKGQDDCQIAYHLCYANRSSFARAFRRWSGKTPVEYRADCM